MENVVNYDNTFDMKIFTKNLWRLMLSRGMSQQDMADAIGASKGTISRYNWGTRLPNIPFLFKIAQYFNVSIDWLLGYNPYRGDASDMEILNRYHAASITDKQYVNSILGKYALRDKK